MRDLVTQDRPLAGRTVVVTRSDEKVAGLASLLQDYGATTVQLPTIRFAEPADGGAAMRRAAADLSRYDWLVFTSANAVERFVPLLGRPPALGGTRVAAIGEGTAAALASAGARPDLVPERYVAEALLDAFPAPPAGGAVLLPRAAVAREVLPEGLRAAGWRVDVVEAYRAERARPPADALDAAAAADAVTFTSASAVRNYLEVAGRQTVPPVVACIGPVTAAAAREAGLEVDVMPEEHTMSALARAVADHLGGSTR